MEILKTWTRETERQTDALEITAEKVYIACYEDEDCSALGCTHAEFLEGKLQAVVLEIFGESVLAEAVDYLGRTRP